MNILTQATGPAASGAPAVLRQSSTLPETNSGRWVCGTARGGVTLGVTRGLFLFIASFLFLAGAAMACPACESAVSSSQETPGGSNRLVRGFARSIYVLMAAPYLLFGGVTFAIVRSARRSKKS